MIKRGPSLFFLDYIASLHKLDKAAFGYGEYLALSIMDMHYRRDTTVEESIDLDTHWNKLLWYCVDNGSYKGCFLPEREEFSAAGCTGTEKAQELDSGYDCGNNFQSSDTPWDDGDDWNSSKVQWGKDENGKQLHTGLWDEADNNFQPSDAPWE